jgi:hypothetical protein
MQKPKKAAPPSNTTPRPMTDAEFFGVPELAKATVTIDIGNRPDWYREWFKDKEAFSKDFPVYAEGWPAVEIFLFCQFQWRHGFNGIEGLDYTAVMPVIALHHPRKSKQLEILHDINALELGAMTAIYERRKEANDKAEAERAKSRK